MTMCLVASMAMTHSVQEIMGLSTSLLEKTEWSKLGLLKDERHIGIPTML